MLELLQREFAGRTLVAVATDRTDGDVHPMTVEPAVLAARQLTVAPAPWSMVDEVHGVDVHRCDLDPDPDQDLAWSATVGVADVISTGAAFRPVGVWVADCAPVVLFDSTGTTVGCHAGWRGLAAGVIDVAVGETDDDVVAVLGPCIHPCCYEFGADDLAVVAAGLGVDVAAISGTTSDGHLALDVPRAVRHALERRGVDLDVVGPCTGCDDRWYSHRVRRDVGRHAVVAWTEQR